MFKDKITSMNNNKRLNRLSNTLDIKINLAFMNLSDFQLSVYSIQKPNKPDVKELVKHVKPNSVEVYKTTLYKPLQINIKSGQGENDIAYVFGKFYKKKHEYVYSHETIDHVYVIVTDRGLGT